MGPTVLISGDTELIINTLKFNDSMNEALTNKTLGGGGTLIHKLYGDVPPFRVWFFDRSAHKQGLKFKDF